MCLISSILIVFDFVGTGDSFWLSAKKMSDGAEQLSILERFAKDVYLKHTENVSTEDRWHVASGAEFWVQVRTSRQTKEAQNINWHFDKDETLRDEGNQYLNPYIGTVT